MIRFLPFREWERIRGFLYILVFTRAMHGLGYLEGNVSVLNVSNSRELHHQPKVYYDYNGMDFSSLKMYRKLLCHIILDQASKNFLASKPYLKPKLSLPQPWWI